MKDGLAKVFGFHRPRESLGSPSSAAVQRMNVVGREERVNEKVSSSPPPHDRPPSGGKRRKERKVVREEGGRGKDEKEKRSFGFPPTKKNLFPFSVHTILRFLQIFFHLPPLLPLSQSEAGCGDGLQQVRNEFPEIEAPCLSEV